MKLILDAFVSRASAYCSLVSRVISPPRKREKTLGRDCDFCRKFLSINIGPNTNPERYEIQLVSFSGFHMFHVVLSPRI